MSEDIFSSKTKADLIEIVRMTGILPVGKAQKMKKQDLVDFLQGKVSTENLLDYKAEAAKQINKRKTEAGTHASSNYGEAQIALDDNLAANYAQGSNQEHGQEVSAADTSIEQEKNNSEQQEDRDNNFSKSARKAGRNKENKQANSNKGINEEQAESNAETSTVQPETGQPEAGQGDEELLVETEDFVAKARPRKKNSKNSKKTSNHVGNNTDKHENKAKSNSNSKNEKIKENSEAEQEEVSGVLELMSDGYGFLRCENYIQGPKDVYVQSQLIKRFSLRTGDLVTGFVKNQRDQDKYRALNYITSVNERKPEEMSNRKNFERLTPVYPDEKYKLETDRNELSTRIIDLFSPIGKGQRGMIVSPPKAGKTILLQKIANAISTNNPKTKLFVLLIDERPEEVTDMQRRIDGEVVYSTFDKSPENHVKISELVLERAKRLVELGEDVVILVDSLTRMARAYNLTINPTGRTLSGGLDPGALHYPKRFFGAARNIENGGSLTIIATALVETGSRMDEVIFEEFKGTGNMEVYLDRKLSEKRIFPAIDVNRSSTRREELLLTEAELESVWAVRRAFSTLDTGDVTELIISLMTKTKDNAHMIESLNLSLKDQNLLNSMKAKTENNSSAAMSSGNYKNNSAGAYSYY